MTAKKSPTKDVIYIDNDDDITSIIDKLQQTTQSVVAIVLPRRTTVLQSIVNMRLLKRMSETEGKQIALITADSALLPLAGIAGIHVAKTLQSKPVIPAAPETSSSAVDAVPADSISDSGVSEATKGTTTIAVPAVASTAAVANAIDPVVKKDKKLAIPNFTVFRIWTVVGVLLLILVPLFWFIGFKVMPRAQITVATNNSTIQVNSTFTAATGVTEYEPESTVLPAVNEQTKKSEVQKVTATGQKDIGSRATGTVTVSNCTSDAVTIPAGTGFSADGKTFISKQSLSLSDGNFTGGGACKTSGSHVGTVSVTAQENGDSYNLSERNYAIASVPSGVTGRGSTMTGGSSKIARVLTQGDVDNAKQKIVEAANKAATEELQEKLRAAQNKPIIETLSVSEPVIAASPGVGEEAEEATLTVTMNFAMTGVREESLKQLLKAEIEKQIDKDSQEILNDGLDQAIIQPTDNKKPDGSVSLTIKSSAEVGVEQNEDEIKQAIAGMKRGEVEEYIRSQTGVKDVTIDYSPAWVYRTPSDVNKISVSFDQGAAEDKDEESSGQ